MRALESGLNERGNFGQSSWAPFYVLSLLREVILIGTVSYYGYRRLCGGGRIGRLGSAAGWIIQGLLMSTFLGLYWFYRTPRS